MNSNVPIIRKFLKFYLLLQLIIIGLIIYLYDLANVSESFIFGCLTYSIIAFVLRSILSKSHRKGIRLVKERKFDKAIPYFEKSVAYFSKNNWIDKYRFLTLLSASRFTYKEMGLCNIAFCYSQLGYGQKAKDYYQIVLSKNPNNGLAITALNMLNSMDKNQENPSIKN